MQRREFLVGAAAGAAVVAGFARSGRAQTARKADPKKLARIALMTLDFSSMLKLPGQPESPARTLDVFDIAEMYADVYDVHNIEMQHSHILSTEDSYLTELRSRYAKFNSRVTNINLEFGGMNISADDPVMRAQAIDLTCRWVDHAVVLGCPRVMINQGQPTDVNKAWGIPTLRKMGDYGRSKGIMVSVETRGNGANSGGARGSVPTGGAAGRGAGAAAPAPGAAPAGRQGAPAGAPAQGGFGRGGQQATAPRLTVVPAWVLLAQIIKDSNTYANVDMGNVGAQDQGELHTALRALLPMTVDNTHTRVNQYWDLATVVRFMTADLGYRGLFSIETNQSDAVRNIYNIVLDALPEQA